jgi:LPXTG-site transpeptidase (sortase) family protein
MLNVVGNQNGDVLTNQGELRYSSGTTATGTVGVTVLEPVLVVDKTVDDATPALGQTITYSLEISHDLDGTPEDSSSDAYNVQLTDTLPTGLSNLTNITTSSTGGCASGFTTAASTATTLDVTINHIPFSSPAPGCVVTITYDATVTQPSPFIPPPPVVGRTIDNTANLIWTSTSIINPETRSGDSVSGNVDDYETADTQQITITQPELRISKDDGTLTYVPGESVTYTVIVENVGNEAVTAAHVTDAIPAEVLSWTWVCSGSPPPAIGCDGVIGSSSNFSDFINLDAGQSLTYLVTANTDPAAISDMENIAIVDMPAGIVEPTPSDNTDNDIDSATPEADLRISKDDGVTIISPDVTLTYTILVENTSPSNVIGATVEDLIPAEIASWSWACTALTGGASGCDGMANSAVDFTDLVDLPALSSIEYTVTALVSSSASGTLTNTATVTSPAGVTERNLADNTDDDVDGIPVHDKDLVSQVHGVTTLPDVAIGEILTYEITLTVPSGSMTNTHLVDTLDRGLAFVSCESITPGSITTTASGGYASVCSAPTVSTYPVGSPNAEDDGRQVDFDFDTLTNPGPAPADLVIRYRVVVLDSLANQSGSTPLLVNDAEWVWDSGILTDQAAGVNILEPDMSLTKGASPTALYPGQLTTFRLIVEHTPGSETAAYDVELEDIIPDDLIFQSASHVGGQAPTAIITAGDPTILIQWDEFLNNGVNSEIDIVVMLDPAYRQRKYNQFITNDASLSWTSLPGDFSTPQSTHNTLSTERFYDPLSNINIYGLVDSARIRIPALPDTGFAPGRVTDLPEKKEGQEYGDLDGLRLEVSKLGISVPIVSVPKSDNGWDLTWLWNQAGWLEGTAYPSWYGNTVITGHAYLPSGYPGPFVDLGKLSWGDEIVLYSHGLKYTYQTRFVDLVAANDYSILQHKDQDWLTLFTCKDYSDELGGYIWRQAVQAVLIDVEEME